MVDHGRICEFGGVSKHGKIKSVFCRNFVTYSESVLYPSEYLNVIIGPNGTGKSTLVSAIVLGLGGDPKILARSSSIGDYVKNGCDSSSVVVEIYDDDEETVKFERSFDIRGKSHFAIDGAAVTQKVFLAKVTAFKIQIGNLCQFLPQDRVQDFAKMNPQQILDNTINSICEVSVMEKFATLKDLRSRQEDGKTNYKILQQKLEESKHRVEELKSQLDRYNARKEVEEKLNVCLAKKLHLEINEIQINIAEYENDIQLAKQNLATYEGEYAEITKKQSKVEKVADKLKRGIEEKDRALKAADDKKCRITNEIEYLKKKINEAKSNFEKKKRESNERRNELKQEFKMLQVYAQDLKNLTSDEMSEEESEQRENECDKTIENLKKETKNLNYEHRRYVNKIDEIAPETQSLKSRLQSLENSNERKLEFLKAKFPDVYQSTIWINENKEKFVGRIYKPIILEINVKNQAYSKYLENTINMRDLLAFACEDKSDLSRLVTELCTKQKLSINVFYAPVPNDSIFEPRVPIQNIRKYGFESYLIDLVQGPKVILGHLCSIYHLQNIPFGGETVSTCTDKIPLNINNYFGGDLRYNLTISKYGNKEPSLMQSCIVNKGLLSSRDESEINNIKQRLSELIRLSDRLRNERSTIEAQIREKELRYREESKIKKEIQSKRNEVLQKSALLTRQKQKIESIKAEIVALPEMEKELQEVGAKTVIDIINLQKSLLISFRDYQKAITGKRYSKTKLQIFKQENEDLTNLISSLLEKRDSAKARVDQISHKRNISSRDIKSKFAESLALTNNVKTSDPKYIHRSFYNSLPNTLEELRDVISDFSGRLDCMDDVNAEIVREYDAKRNDVETFKQEIESILNGNENFVEEIKNIYDLWYPVVSQVVATINDHFGKFMQCMGYVGEVKLINKDMYEFDTYGIEILVQYRKNVPLQPLNRHVQSGGERAVAIAIYTLSMQHLTHVPFRCVDEINQGMDARNERKIFEMLVDETTKFGSSQYFFVTPKLLRNLKANKRMTVHIVFNGRMVQSKDAFTVV